MRRGTIMTVVAKAFVIVRSIRMLLCRTRSASVLMVNVTMKRRLMGRKSILTIRRATVRPLHILLVVMA